MTSTILMAAMAFLSTNIDDLFILMLFFSQTSNGLNKPDIIIGQYLGIGTLIAVSIIGALGLSVFSHEIVGLLGFVPIYLGIKAIIDHYRNNQSEDSPELEDIDPDKRGESRQNLGFFKRLVQLGVFKVASVTIANGGDNIGIYVPLFIGIGISAMILTMLIFALLTALWCLIGLKLAVHPFIQKNIEAYQHIVVPVVFIGLGSYILMKNGTLTL